MARIGYSFTLGANLGDGRFNSSVAGAAGGSIVTAANTAAGTLTTNVASAVATLVADGASPTQAHVTTLNNAWGLLATAIAATDAAGAAKDIVLDINTSTVTTKNGVRHALRQLMATIEGSELAS